MPNKKMKVAVVPRKPRNPLVVAVRFRRAGSHQKTPQGIRQQEKRALQRELTQLLPGRGKNA